MARNLNDLDPEDIKAAVRKTGTTLSALSKANGYCRSAITIALRRPWPDVERLVAKHLGKQPWAIWPSRYDADGLPLRGVRSNKANTTRRPAALHRQKEHAA